MQYCLKLVFAKCIAALVPEKLDVRQLVHGLSGFLRNQLQLN